VCVGAWWAEHGVRLAAACRVRQLVASPLARVRFKWVEP
jgi:hypothetical protein